MMAALFITYIALLWLVFDKLRLIRMSLPVTIALAAVGPLFAGYILLSMNNYHPSSADARVFQHIVPIVPHISTPGRVQEVVAQPNTAMNKGEVIFTIDPRPFQFDVSRLEAALVAAEQTVPQLKTALDQASATAEKAGVQFALARAEYDRQSELFEKKVVAQATLDKAERNLETARQGVAEVQAAEQRAKLAYDSNVGGENTGVAQVRQQLEQARYNLAEATVRAPCDGYVTNMQLEAGAVVSAAASVVPFICNRDKRHEGIVVASFMQSGYLQITAEDYAEVVFPLYPGRVFTGKVETTIDVAAEGQLQATGLFPAITRVNESRFPVRIKLDHASGLRLPAGAQGDAAVFTGNVQIAGVIRMALMRMTSWTNYLFLTG